MFHRFEAELGANPVLVHVTRLLYRETSAVSLLISAQTIGYRFANGVYESESLPPLEFFYSDFNPDCGYALLVDEFDKPVPGLSFSSGWQMADLYGTGAPGLLYHDGVSTMYRQLRTEEETSARPDEQLRFTPAEPLALFPKLIHPNEQKLWMTDLNGSGRLDLILRESGQYGYYESNPDRTWSAYRPLASVPSVYGEQQPQFSVDVTGSGLSDWLAIEEDRVVVYPSLGSDGFGRAIVRERVYGLPTPRRGALNEWFDFAAITGLGLKQLVRITNGRVECWPNLGYGRFGKPVTLAGAPYFEDDLDISRLFLADVNGTGLADLIYVNPDSVDIYLNQSGNSFAEPINIPLPAGWDRLSQIRFVDVYGSGTACLLFSEDNGSPKHWCCDFNRGNKPYLLQRFSNNLGSETRISYCTSTKFYLADVGKGLPWIAKLPFPVQVVDKVERFDFISGTKEVSLYTYHHGYYDSLEREFRGFGMVERQDAESVMIGAEPTDVPPVLTKTWYHTGSWDMTEGLSLQYVKAYYGETDGADRLPDSVFDVETYRSHHPGWIENSATAREANRAFKGMLLRQEIFAPTAPAGPGQKQDAPYRVTELNFEVELVQPPHHCRFGIYVVHQRETLTCDYERNPADPQITHELTLEVDNYGNVLRSCVIAYGRNPLVAGCLPEQRKTVIHLVQHRYANQADNQAYLIGVPIETLIFDIRQLPLPEGKQRYSFVETALRLADAASHPETSLAGGIRHYYWSPEQREALALGLVSPQCLLYAMDSLYFSSGMLAGGFDGIMTDNEIKKLLETEGGYRRDTNNWWAFDFASEYGDQDSYYRVQANVDAFGNRTTYHYDAYSLLMVSVTDALHNTAVMEQGDYLCLLPQRIIDRNRNVSEVIYDALGRVRVASRYAESSGERTGFIPLAQYQLREKAAINQLVQDPSFYLQGASHFYEYDLRSWMGSVRQADFADIGIDVRALWQELLASGCIGYCGGVTQQFREFPDAQKLPLSEAFELYRSRIYDTLAQAAQSRPACVVSLDAVQYVRDDRHSVQSPIRIGVEFRDGSGRLVQYKHLVEPGEAFVVDDPALLEGRAVQMGQASLRWLATGGTVYNNKGQPVKQYEPYFVNTAEYVNCEALHRCGVSPTFEYDPLGRVRRIISAKGFVRRIDRGAWEENDWDGIDTMLESPYYAANIGGFDPASSYYNPDMTDEERLTMAKSIKLAGTPERKLFDAQGHTVQVATYKAPDQLLATRYEWDSNGNLLASADPRLGAAGLHNFRYAYNYANQCYRTSSVDGGNTQWTLWNANGQPILSRHGLHTRRFFYDELHRLTSVLVHGPDDSMSIVEVMVYGESLELQQAQENNLRGELYKRYDQSGQTTHESYSLDAHPMRVSHRFAHNYRDTLNWSRASVANAEEVLEKQSFAETFDYDALGQLVAHTDSARNKANWQYGLAGWLLRAEVQGMRENMPHTAFQIASCNARGQWLQLLYGNDGHCSTSYEYDSRTFDPVRVRTRRANHPDIQDLQVFYDPIGHVCTTKERALPFTHEDRGAEMASRYTYDACYRLIQATGWEGDQPDAVFPLGGDAKLQSYQLDYKYDDSGNLYETVHRSDRDHHDTRTLSLTVSSCSNRAVPSSQTMDAAQVDALFDASGCLKQDEHCSNLQWDYDQRLRSFIAGNGASRDYYVYDQNGHRARKVTESLNADGNVVSIEETRYIGHLEISSRYRGAAIDPLKLEARCETARLMIHHRNVATRVYWTTGSPVGEEAMQVRYSLHDQVGSCVTEVDSEGAVLAREAYYPYGGTAWSASSGDAIKHKKLRYAGKEKDGESGFYDYGQRYYAPSSARWLSPDPAGTIDGLNLYAYVGGNPVTYTDPHGLMPSRARAEFNVEVVARSSGNGGGMKLRVTGRPKKFTAATLRLLAKRRENRKYFKKRSNGRVFKKQGYTRNHIQPWLTIKKEQETATRGFTLNQMESYLRHDIDVSTFSNKAYKDRFVKMLAKKKMKRKHIEEAFRAVLVDEYNNPDNLFIGKSGKNLSMGAIMKARQTKLKKTYGTNQLTDAERDDLMSEFRDAALDTPSHLTAAQIQDVQNRFNSAWGRNRGKYI
ncbi:toxin TcdB middle/N-terminal domain-containing protein [Paenibacillus cellulosilyticus]